MNLNKIASMQKRKLPTTKNPSTLVEARVEVFVKT